MDVAALLPAVSGLGHATRLALYGLGIVGHATGRRAADGQRAWPWWPAIAAGPSERPPMVTGWSPTKALG